MHETAQRLLAAGLAKGERTFTGIARTLGASDQSATNWKTRGVPRRVMIRAAALYGVDAAWLAGDADGKAPAFLATRSYPTASASAPAPKVNEARPDYAMTDDERLLLDGYRLAVIACDVAWSYWRPMRLPVSASAGQTTTSPIDPARNTGGTTQRELTCFRPHFSHHAISLRRLLPQPHTPATDKFITRTSHMTSSDPVSVIGIIVMLVLYLLPTINGYSKKHRSRGLIAAINIFFGWTLVGWVVAAIWSFGSARDDQPTDLTHVKCPDCAELVLREAKVCKHCGYRFESP